MNQKEIMQEAVQKIRDMYIDTNESEKCKALKTAISALEKQIPKKVVDDTEFGMCPYCHNEFNSELMNEYNVKYCLHCGQALDWDYK